MLRSGRRNRPKSERKSLAHRCLGFFGPAKLCKQAGSIFKASLSEPAKILQVISLAANRVLRGEMDAKIVHALGHLVQCALRAYELGELAGKIAPLERLQNTESPLPVLAAPEIFDFEEVPAMDESSLSEEPACE